MTMTKFELRTSGLLLERYDTPRPYVHLVSITVMRVLVTSAVNVAQSAGVGCIRSVPFHCSTILVAHQSLCVPVGVQAITGSLPYAHPSRWNAILMQQTNPPPKRWNCRYGSRISTTLRHGIIVRKFTKGRYFIHTYIVPNMMHRLSLVHISREMLLRFGKIIARLICNAAHFSSCSGIRFSCFCYWLFTK